MSGAKLQLIDVQFLQSMMEKTEPEVKINAFKVTIYYAIFYVHLYALNYIRVLGIPARFSMCFLDVLGVEKRR